MSNLPEPTVQPTRYDVSLLPDDDINHRAFLITIEQRGDGKWAVMHCGFCLGVDGTWDFESIPSGRVREWLRGHRFPLREATQRAVEVAPFVTVNGHTAADAYRASLARATAEGAGA
jgi:hypothetical protein